MRNIQFDETMAMVQDGVKWRRLIAVSSSGPDLAGGRPGAQWRIWDFRKGGNTSHRITGF